ncbi:MAG TPA: hypothetical protein PKV48_05810, partial [Thermodesulfobacteriota bacterium]|nr:hypothetical protein [Thermodesulfobacteriota bacterium]
FCCLLALRPILADTYHSDMGYTLTVPEGWTILNKDNVRNKPEAIDAAMKAAGENQGFSAMPEEVFSTVKGLLVSGKVDYYYSPDRQFSISVYKGSGEIPQSESNQAEMCSNLADELSKQVERNVKVYDCQNKIVDGHGAFYMVADDYWKGHKNIQYMIQKNNEEILLFTASSQTRNFDDMKKEFENVMASLKISDGAGTEQLPGQSVVVEKETTTTTETKDGHRGVLSTTFDVVGEIIALPFRIVGGLIRAIF